MLLSKFKIEDYKKEYGSYDKLNSYQCIHCEVTHKKSGHLLIRYAMPIEAAFVEGDKIHLLKVDAEEFQKTIQYFKDVLEDDIKNAKIDFSYGVGNDNGDSILIDVMPVAYIEETNALYFEKKNS